MKKASRELLLESRLPVLCKADREACTDVLDALLLQRHPSCVIETQVPFLDRYYARLLVRLLPSDAFDVVLCPRRKHRDIAGFLSSILKDVSLSAATDPGAKRGRLLVFRHAELIAAEEIALLKEVQRAFPGLALGYLMLGRCNLWLESGATTVTLAPDAALERQATLVKSSVSPLLRRRLLQLFGGVAR
jgi:hypothetical protein